MSQALSQGGATLIPDEATCMPRIAALPTGLFAAGSVAGIWAPQALIQDGRRAGLAAASQGEMLWDALNTGAGQPFGIRPVGIKAQRVLRLEKGHIIVGQDTDSLSHPAKASPLRKIT